MDQKRPPSSDDRTIGKLSFCLTCKDETETIIITKPGLLWPMKYRFRVCRKCAEPKAYTELEMDKSYGSGHY
jgi:hypothetical protein